MSELGVLSLGDGLDWVLLRGRASGVCAVVSPACLAPSSIGATGLTCLAPAAEKGFLAASSVGVSRLTPTSSLSLTTEIGDTTSSGVRPSRIDDISQVDWLDGSAALGAAPIVPASRFGAAPTWQRPTAQLCLRQTLLPPRAHFRVGKMHVEKLSSGPARAGLLEGDTLPVLAAPATAAPTAAEVVRSRRRSRPCHRVGRLARHRPSRRRDEVDTVRMSERFGLCTPRLSLCGVSRSSEGKAIPLLQRRRLGPLWLP